MVNNIILFLLIVLAARYDLAERKIPNFLTVPVVCWGIISNTFSSGVQGLLFSILGFIAGLAIFFIPFALGGMGAGDVKLMGAIGSVMGWIFIIRTSLYTALAGGVIVILYSIYTGKLLKVLKSTLGMLIKPFLWLLYTRTNSSKILVGYNALRKTEDNGEPIFIPYGVAIGIGTLIVMGERYIVTVLL